MPLEEHGPTKCLKVIRFVVGVHPHGQAGTLFRLFKPAGINQNLCLADIAVRIVGFEDDGFVDFIERFFDTFPQASRYRRIPDGQSMSVEPRPGPDNLSPSQRLPATKSLR